MVKKRKKLPEPFSVAAGLHSLLAAMGGSRPGSRLDDLWREWPQIIGEELAEWVLPLGHHGDALLLGAPTSMQLQELQFVSEEIREAANGYLGCEYFTQARVCLAEKGKICRVVENPPPGKESGETQPVITLTGEYLCQMDKSSPVYACYARFAAHKQ